jgi:hypothetical protein
MSDPNTLYVLSIDGGGERGLISTCFMEQFCVQAGINPNEIWKKFDVISGSSIGGIQALAYAKGLSPTDIKPFFTEDGPWIFTTSSSTASVRPSMLSKINTIVNGPFANPTFYPSTTDGIGTRRLKEKLTEVFGTDILTDLHTNVVITSFEKNDADPEFEQSINCPVYFSNSSIVPVLRGQNYSAVDVCMATSAAPLYFPPYAIETYSFIDGGVTQNNPAPIAIAVGKALKKNANRVCLLSVGTGLGDVGFGSPYGVATIQQEIKEFKESPKLYAEKYNVSEGEMSGIAEMHNLGLLEGAYLIMFLLGALNTAPQEAAAMEINIRSNYNYTRENLFSLRFNYFLEDDKDTEMDFTTPDILSYYQSSAAAKYSENSNEISTFIGHLNA